MAKRKRRRRGRGLLLILAVALMVAGLLARRLMAPGAVRHLLRRPPDSRAASGEQRPEAVGNGNALTSEHLSESDRRALDEVLRRKSEGR